MSSENTTATDSSLSEPASAGTPARTNVPPDRLPWIDTARGLAILAVVLIHVCGHCSQSLTPGAKLWYGVILFKHVVHFAVPSFLLISLLVNAGSLLRRHDLKRYALSRLLTVVWPYLLWSLFYMLYQHRHNMAGLRWEKALYEIVWGKAYPHLYFMVVLIQLLALLPFLLPVIRRRPPFWGMALAAIGLTLGVYFTNRYLVRLPFVGSFVLWYTPVLSLGLWLAGQPERAPSLLRRSLPVSALLTALVAIPYFTLGVTKMLNLPVDTFHYQLSEWAYHASASFLLLCLAARWHRPAWSLRALHLLGRYSLQIYLIHPLVLLRLDPVLHFRALPGLLFVATVYLAGSLLIPLAFAWLTERARVSVALFGR